WLARLNTPRRSFMTAESNQNGTPANPVATRAKVVRHKTLALVDQLAERGRVFELPRPPAALAECRRKLGDENYKVLVVGEAKRGKSTFVNALIGRSLLPTDVDIATSQVFLVQH